VVVVVVVVVVTQNFGQAPIKLAVAHFSLAGPSKMVAGYAFMLADPSQMLAARSILAAVRPRRAKLRSPVAAVARAAVARHLIRTRRNACTVSALHVT
jgi:hypothetical protein